MIKKHGGIFGRNPKFNNVSVEGDLSLEGNFIINGEIITGLDYEGIWDADTNTPTIVSGTAVRVGQFYIVGVAGSTVIDGISNWGVGDWIIYDGVVWQRVEGGADGNFVELSFTGTAIGPTYETSNAVTGLTITDNAISADGTDADIDIDITPKGTGEVNLPKADIDGGTIDNTTIATSDITVGAGKTLDVSGGTLTLADDQISGDKVEGGTINATTINTLTSTTVNTTTLDATDIEVTNIKAKDGTAAGSIADATGVVTLASSVLTTTDIDGGTIDNTTIGGTTAAVGTFTTANATTFDTNVVAAKLTLSGTTLAAAGTDTNVGIQVNPKGTGGVGIGGDTSGVVAGVTVISKFCVKNQGAGPVGGFVHANDTSAITGSGVFACRSRGTLAAPTIVQDDDRLASLFFAGHDGTDLALAAEIGIEVDGTPGSDDMPGRIIFNTTPDGSQIPAEAMRINSSQEVIAAVALSSPAYRLAASGIITEAGTSRTLAAGDNGKVIYCTNGAAITITCDTGLGAGFSVTIVQGGDGKVTLAAGTATLNSYSGLLSTMGKFAVVSLISPVADEFLAAGNLGL
jgi:hypothetical protein